MAPSLTYVNVSNGHSANPKAFSQFDYSAFLREVEPFNLSNICLGQSGVAILLTSNIIVSAFGKHIFNVIHLSSQKQVVISADATRVVTAMKHSHSFRNSPIHQFPRCSVGKLIQSESVKSPIPFLVFAPNPLPTVAGFIDLAPKSFLSGLTRLRPFCNLAANNTNCVALESQCMTATIPVMPTLAQITEEMHLCLLKSITQLKLFYNVHVALLFLRLPSPGCNCQENTAGSSSILQHLIPTEKYC